MKNDNIAIVPFFSRYNSELKVNEELTRKQIDELTMHYSRELIHKINQHGFDLNDTFFKDFELAHEAFKSTLLRNIGKFHPLQEYVDALEELDNEDAQEDESTELDT